MSDDRPGPAPILIIAGEASGDDRASALVHALREQDPDLAFFGIGGPRMRAEGVETLYDVADMAVVGITEVLRRYWFFRGVFHRMLREARTRKPAAVILVDYPGFNLRFAARARRMGIRVIYYVCPQVWAWHRGRIPKMAAIIDRLITIFPFEPRYFEGTGLRVDFAGHPLVDEAAQVWAEPEAALPWNGEPRVALLPGSRAQEIERLLPDMWAAAGNLQARHPNASFIIATPTDAERDRIRAKLATLPGGPRQASVVSGQTRQVLRQAHAGIVASGTATLEASLMLCPMIIVYRVSPLTYALARRVVRIPHIGLVNVVAGRGICPEFIQDAVTPAALADALERLLGDDDARTRLRRELQAVNAALGSGGAASRAAARVIEELRR